MIVNKKQFMYGIILAVIFAVTFTYMWTPNFGPKNENAFQYADRIFNSIAKDSSYSIPEMSKGAEKQVGQELKVSVKADDPEQAKKIATLYELNGANVKVSDVKVSITGDLGVISKAAIADSDVMYKNDVAALTGKYGYNGKEAMYNWWFSFDKMSKDLQKNKQFDTDKYISSVKVKALEPAYNFIGINAKSASERSGVLSALLVFYLVYTMLWGFAIFYICEGFGILMVKNET